MSAENPSLDELLLLATDEKLKPENITKAVAASGAVLFHDQYDDPYIAFNGDGTDVSKVSSKKTKQWLAYYVHSLSGQVISTMMTSQVLQTLAGQARFVGPSHTLEVRCVKHDDALWYDLGSSAIQITDNGWQQVEQPPIIFKRFAHHQPQVLPKSGGDLRTLLKYVNINDKGEQLLFLVYVVAAFIPDFPHALLIFHGPQGAGKTTPMKVMKELIDPSALSGVSEPKNKDELVQMLSHHCFLFLDNLSKVPEWLSDALARAVTGDSLAKRELYTDDDDVIYRFQKVIALNGINQIVRKSDLLDRAVLIRLERISTQDRKESQIFWQEFEQDRALILGAIFDVLVKALRLYPTIKLTHLPRMADFARWGYAIAEAAGFSGSDFTKAYKANVSTQNDEAIEASPLAQAIVAFMENREYWSGTPSELYEVLEPTATDLHILQSKGWPKDPARLSTALTLLIPNLLERGIKAEKTRGKVRTITLTISTDATDATTVDTDGDDDGTTVATVK